MIHEKHINMIHKNTIDEKHNNINSGENISV